MNNVPPNFIESVESLIVTGQLKLISELSGSWRSLAVSHLLNRFSLDVAVDLRRGTAIARCIIDKNTMNEQTWSVEGVDFRFCTNVYIECCTDLLAYSPKLNNPKYEVSFKKLRQLIDVPVRGCMDWADSANGRNFMMIYDLSKGFDANSNAQTFFSIPSYLGALHLSGIRCFHTEIEDLVERQPRGYLRSVHIVKSDITSRCLDLLIDKFSYKRKKVPGPNHAPRILPVTLCELSVDMTLEQIGQLTTNCCNAMIHDEQMAIAVALSPFAQTIEETLEILNFERFYSIRYKEELDEINFKNEKDIFCLIVSQGKRLTMRWDMKVELYE
ncbi:hypothetical protein QR680_010336 [Steinernema hermaphroditum]|uniref:Uncharacterized protein n=1 Tax=Steinernema hermaphroditum TaxID=289476 RepID=A0AA39IQ85_9BILA|nr:hypothetical protein QR680_010336 [Steinernema hermaphroditum]